MTTTTAAPRSRWTPAEATALAQLLIPAPIDPLHSDIEIDLVTEQIPVTGRSPYSGRTLGDTQVRSRTGASIVAVLRRSGAVPSPTPDFRFAIGDTLVVVGTREGVDAVGRPDHGRLRCTTPQPCSIELGAVLLALGILGRIAWRFGFSPIPLYLLAGLAFGHGGLLPLDASEEFVATGAEIGVILLLLLLGLEYTAADLVGTLKTQYVSGVVDFLLNALPGAHRRAAARLGTGRRRGAGRRHLDLVVRRDREGARRPRPAG